MTVHSVTLHLPETLYERFRQRAEWTHRSLEAELLDVVASAASLYPLAEEGEEDEWQRAVARNPAFQDLEATEEDLYSPGDGEPFDPRRWDQQIEEDFKEGRLDNLISEALEDLKAGRARDL